MHSRPLEYDDFACVIISALSKELLSFPPALFRILTQTEQRIKADPAYVFSLGFEDLGLHALLAAVDLQASPEAIRTAAAIHGRLVDATDDEIEAAATTVTATLLHPIMPSGGARSRQWQPPS